MLFARLRETLHTLRFRLAAWVALVAFLVVTFTFIAVRELVRRTLVHEFNQRLLQDAVDVKLAYQQLYPDREQFHTAMNRKAQDHPHVGWFLQWYDGDGNLMWSSINAPKLPPPREVGDEPELRDAGEFRTAVARLDEPGLPTRIARLGSTWHSVEDDVSLLNRILLLAGISVLVLAPVGGYLLAGRATRPLAQIIATTSKLQPRNLGERLPLRGTGDELDQVSQTINSMLDRIATYLESNRDFIANAAHELRSPLAAIRTSVDVALDRLRTPDEYAGLLQDVAEECGRLTNLLNRLLLLAEGDAGRLVASGHQARLDKIVRESVDMFEPVADAQGVELKVSNLASVLVDGDEYHLRQVVRNLIDNAIKFTPASGRVTVELATDGVRNQAILRVSDTGVGISAQDLPRIFERFYRADRSRRREGGPGGSGLGLAICSTVVSALQGTIQVNSQPGQGSVFTVTLPLVSS